jgi:hypothetical protein
MNEEEFFEKIIEPTFPVSGASFENEQPQQVTNAISYFKHIILDKLEGVDCWVAGGAVRDYFSVGRPQSDIDIFFPSQEQYDLADKKLEGNFVIEDTNNAKLYSFDKKKIHIIKKQFYANPQITIEDFDFTVCCAAIDRIKLYNNQNFFIDLAGRRLVINRLTYPLSTLQRMQKYIKKGYWICNGGLLELAKGIQKVDFSNKDQSVLEYYPDGSPKFMRID